jgi:hypothetical protein
MWTYCLSNNTGRVKNAAKPIPNNPPMATFRIKVHFLDKNIQSTPHPPASGKKIKDIKL